MHTYRKKPLPHEKKLANAAIIGVSAILVSGLGWAAVQEQQAQARAADSVAAYTPPSSPETETVPTRFTPTEDAVADLEDTSEPWVLTVLGDSTGDEPEEWVQIVTRDLAETTGRPATIHTWNVETNEYADTTEIPGDGEPIVVWNASASGKHTGYTLQHLPDMAPQAPNLVVISHGHNQTSTENTPREMRTLAERLLGKWRNAPALAVTLQNPRTDGEADRQESIIEQFRDEWGARPDVTTIDVFNAYQDADDMSGLLRPDGFHPNENGAQVWADTAQDVLNLDGAGN